MRVFDQFVLRQGQDNIDNKILADKKQRRATNNFQNGKYSEIAFRYSEADKMLYISQRKGDFEGMTPKRTFKIVFVNEKSAFGNDNFPQKVQTIQYDGSKTSVSL